MRSKYNSVCGLLDVHGYRNRHGRPDYKRHGRVAIPAIHGPANADVSIASSTVAEQWILLQAGVPVSAISARLGHANAGITLSIYSHSTTDAEAEAAKVAGSLLSGVLKPQS